MAISEAFVLGRSGDEGGQELQSMAAACALTAWRPKETSDSLQRTAAHGRKRVLWAISAQENIHFNTKKIHIMSRI